MASEKERSEESLVSSGKKKVIKKDEMEDLSTHPE